MITVSDKEKYVYLWFEAQGEERDRLSKYIEDGYKVIRISNGSGNIRSCMKTIVQSSMR